ALRRRQLRLRAHRLVRGDARVRRPDGVRLGAARSPRGPAARGHTSRRRTDQMKPSYQKCISDTTSVTLSATRCSLESTSSAHTPKAPAASTIAASAAAPPQRARARPRRSRRLLRSLHHTRPKYCHAWKKFMMKNASPKLLKPQV